MTVLLFIVYLLVLGIGYWLKFLNLSYVKSHGQTVPPEFQGSIDPGHLQKISAYTFETSRMGFVESMTGNLILIVFLFGGVIGFYDGWIRTYTDAFIPGGILFFLVLLYAETIIGIPFSLYRNFRIESRFGFNTMTSRLWFTDLIKSTIIATLLACAVIAATLAIVASSPTWWWLWVWCFLLAFGIFMMYISPYVIEPLFFKFEPVKVEGLEEKVRALMEQAGLKVSRVFQVDASRRSKHSNAYFTGIGKVKRIVLFDTLIEQMTEEEILAVLAHEVGHWKKRHVLKRIFMTETMALAGLYGASLLLTWDGLPGLLGLEQASFYAKVVIVGLIGSIILFPFTPVFSFLSRRDEREADRFSTDLTGSAGAMASALVKLSKDNLSNIHPHPLYAAFYYSHPPVVERIRKLKEQETVGRSQ